nr:MAG TPA: hypothetical protein [Caudoviricetes sp.]
MREYCHMFGRPCVMYGRAHINCVSPFITCEHP